uniref:Uncharacterized protein n=1 Tax=Arundo donax TaxID=35708 RepID=A0A0A9H785_ARUDO
MTPSMPPMPRNWLPDVLKLNVVSLILHSLNVSHPEACVRFATTAPPPPWSAVRYVFRSADLNCTCVPSRRSLLGMPSKRGGRIHPSVTSQPPRHTARTGRLGYDDEAGLPGGFTGCVARLPWEREQRHEAHRRRRKQRRLTSLVPIGHCL